MKNRFFAALVPVAFMGSLALTPAAAQSGGADRPNVLRTLDGKPDISGVWTSPGFRHFDRSTFPDVPLIGMTRFSRTDYPFRPGGQELWNRKLNGVLRNDDPTAICLPWGFPHQTLLSNVQHFFQSPGYLVIVYEDMHFTRIIPMDGREHPKGLPRTYYGNSVGKYEGNVAVIDTVGLIPWGLDDSGSVSNGNHMFSDAAHFIERYQRLGPGTMSYELTIDDPKIFTKPWTCGSETSHCFPDGQAVNDRAGRAVQAGEAWVMRLRPEWEIIEQYCEDNNKEPGLTDFLNHPK